MPKIQDQGKVAGDVFYFIPDVASGINFEGDQEVVVDLVGLPASTFVDAGSVMFYDSSATEWVVPTDALAGAAYVWGIVYSDGLPLLVQGAGEPNLEAVVFQRGDAIVRGSALLWPAVATLSAPNRVLVEAEMKKTIKLQG
jgi:hypothetical protein